MGILGAISPKLVLIGMITYLPTYLPVLAISFIMAIRRLNDMDHPGWWSLLNLVPFLNFFFGLWLVFGPGDEGRNSYGPPPSKNTAAVIAGACILPAFMVLSGILAAIAIPAYRRMS